MLSGVSWALDPACDRVLLEQEPIGITPSAVEACIVRSSDSVNHDVADRAGLGGVAKLSAAGTATVNFDIGPFEFDTNWSGSGVLLATGRHVLTAAHCIKGTETVLSDGTSLTYSYIATSGTVTFRLPGGRDVAIPVSKFTAHPGWDHNALHGNDIGILELEFTAPSEIERYDVYRLAGGTPVEAAELGSRALLVGYGLKGTGTDGATPDTDGTERWGWNQYDATMAGVADVLNGDSQLVFDFDNGLAANDCLGILKVHTDLGLGDFEVNIASGDSGGPGFVDGLVAGIHSYGRGFEGLPDVKPGTNSSFGEIAVDTRVSAYADWIDSVTGVQVADEDGSNVVLSPAGGWTASSLGGVFGDSQYSGRTTARAVYTFTSLSSGWYEVAVNTPESPDYTTDRAVYTITSGAEKIVTTVDQRPGTQGWRTLDTIYVGASDLQVTLTQGGKGNLRTDAVRITPITGYQVVDDDTLAGTPYTETGTWYASSLAGFGGDSRYTYTGTATYTFDGLVADGWYEVSVRTPRQIEYTTSIAIYTISSGANRVVTTLDQRPGTNGWLTLDQIQAKSSSVQVQLTNGAQDALRSDAVRIRRIPKPSSATLDDQVPAGAGYLETAGAWTGSTKGYSADSRYSSSTNASARYTFDSLPAEWYEVQVNYLCSQYDSDRVLYTLQSGGASVSVTVDQRAGSQGWKPLEAIRVDGGSLTVELAQKGTGSLRADGVRIVPVAEPAYRILDDTFPTGAGYAETGAWSASGLLGYGGDSRYSTKGTATWSFSAVTPGWYEVEVNLPASSTSTDRAAYTITSGTNKVVVNLDQRPGTDGWKRLNTFQAKGDLLKVQVAQGGKGAVRADAVRIRRIESFFAVYERELNAYLDSRVATLSQSSPTTALASPSVIDAAIGEMLSLSSSAAVRNSVQGFAALAPSQPVAHVQSAVALKQPYDSYSEWTASAPSTSRLFAPIGVDDPDDLATDESSDRSDDRRCVTKSVDDWFDLFELSFASPRQ